MVAMEATNRKYRGSPPHISEQIHEVCEITFSLIFWVLQSIYFIAESVYRWIKKPEPKSVKGEIVLITGTGHGIGKELALQYAAGGATVVGLDINKENNDATIAQINREFQNKATGYLCNVADRENILEVARKIEQEVGEVTILVVNAGILICHLLEEHTPDEIRRTVDINLMQYFWLLEAFLPTMKRNNHGHIVGLSSIAGLAGCRNLVPYCATKFAVRGLLESLREELRHDKKNKIKITAIYPYMVNTGLCKNPHIRFNNLMPLLSPEDVAKEIVLAQRRDEFETTFPLYLYSVLKYLRLFPYKAIMKGNDLLDAGIDSDLLSAK